MRNRLVYGILIMLTIAAGLLSRKYFSSGLIHLYLGDILYALMIFFIVAWLFPKMPVLKVALFSFLFCSLIELSQFYQADWINQIRSYKLGGLILGYGFLWSDILSYAIGVLSGVLIEKIAVKVN